jgi:hypothetical protein
MKARWLALVLLLVLGAGMVLTRPASPVGPVLYLRLRLAPYGGPGAAMAIQYWIDGAGGRLRYAESLLPSGPAQPLANGSPVSPRWYTIALRQRRDGACAVTYTDLLDQSERGLPFVCQDLLALRDVRALQARLQRLRTRYGRQARVTAHAIRIPLPAGTDPLPLVMDRFNMRYGYETLAPGTLVLDRRSGRLVSVSGYHRDGVTMTTTLVAARDLPAGTLRSDFFDPPPFSLPDRAPGLYRWLHAILPWHP